MLSPGENRMQSIVGTWKLLHATARDAAGAARPLPYGGKALGRLTLTADGRMMSLICDGRTQLPAGVRMIVDFFSFTRARARVKLKNSAGTRPYRVDRRAPAGGR